MSAGGEKISATAGRCVIYGDCFVANTPRNGTDELAEIFRGFHRLQVENEEMESFLRDFSPFRDTMNLALIRADDPEPKNIERLRYEFGVLKDLEFYFHFKREILKYFLGGSHLAADSIDAQYVRNAARLVLSFREDSAPLAARDERTFADDFMPQNYAELQMEVERRIAILGHPAVRSHIERMQVVVETPHPISGRISGKGEIKHSISDAISLFSDNRNIIRKGFRDWRFMALIPGRESELADAAPPPELYDKAVAELRKIQKISQRDPAEAERRFEEFRMSPVHRKLEHFLAGYHGLKDIRTSYMPKLAITASAGFASGLATLSLSALYPALEAGLVGQTGLALAGGGAFLVTERPLSALVLDEKMLPGANAAEQVENAATDLIMMSAMLRVLHGSMRLVGGATEGLARFGTAGEFARLSTSFAGEFSVLTGWEVVEGNARLALNGKIDPALVWSHVNSFKGHANRALFLGGLKVANFALSPAFRPIGGRVQSWALAKRDEGLQAVGEEQPEEPARHSMGPTTNPTVTVLMCSGPNADGELGGSVPPALRGNRGARGPGAQDGPRTQNRPFNHKPEGDESAVGSANRPAAGAAAPPTAPRMNAAEAISKFAPAREYPVLHSWMSRALREARGLPRDARVQLETVTDSQLPPLIAKTFHLLNNEINNSETVPATRERDIKTLEDLFRFVEAVKEAGFEIPVADLEVYKQAKNPRIVNTPPADERPRKSRGRHSNASRLIAKLLPDSSKDRSCGYLRSEMLIVLCEMIGKKSRTLQRIEDSQLPHVVEQTFKNLVNGIKTRETPYNKGKRPIEYGALEHLDRFVRGIAEDNSIDIPFVKTPEYRDGMRKYLAEGKKWREPGKGGGAASTYKVTSSKSAEEIAGANSWVQIGTVDGMKLEIKAGEMGTHWNVAVFVKLRGEEIGSIIFRKKQGYKNGYKLISANRLRKTRFADGALITRQIKEAITDAIIESFKKTGKK